MTIFPSLVVQAGLESTVRYVEVTVFVPSDNAFSGLTQLLQDPDTIKRYVSHHVVLGVWSRERLVDGLELKTMWGQTVRLSVGGEAYRIDGVDIDSLDVVASNGVAHILDGIMIPSEETAAPATPPPTPRFTASPIAGGPIGPSPPSSTGGTSPTDQEFPWQFTPFAQLYCS